MQITISSRTLSRPQTGGGGEEEEEGIIGLSHPPLGARPGSPSGHINK